jgi:hypothetical protein
VSFAVYLDEDVDVDLAPLLKEHGFDVLTTREAKRAHQGISDDGQLAFAAAQGRAIVTHNIKDFMPLARDWAGQDLHHAGIITCPHRPLWALAQGFIILREMYPDGPVDICLGLPLPRSAM